MYQIGQLVVYGIHGVCRITQLENRKVSGKVMRYLVLEPLLHESSQYLVPAENPVVLSKLRPVLTQEHMQQLLTSSNIFEDAWIPDEGQRKHHYRDLIGSGDVSSMLRMLHSVYLHRREQLASGKKVHQCDDNFLRDAERQLCEEICIVMQLPMEQAKAQLRSQLRYE